MQATLLVVAGQAGASQFSLRLPTIIGRGDKTDLILGHPLVSRHHCEVFEAGGLLMVRDLGSLNGTYVGASRVLDDAMPILPGERFTVGPITFQANYRAAVATFDSPAQPPPLPSA